MAQNLTEDFIDLSDRGFSPHRTPELALNHREGSLHVRPLVIVSQESVPIKVVEVPHSLPQSIKGFSPLTSFRITPKWDIRRGVYRLNSVEIILAGISFIGRHFVNVESLGSSLNQLGKLRGIRCLSRSNLNILL